jgi:modulator of FtsH protease HflC
MRAEREREATDERARGEEAALRVRAQADRTVVELISDARRESEIIRGEADAERNAIFANAFNQDREFFEFYRSMTAYERALMQRNSTMVISPDSEFFEYLAAPALRCPRPSSNACRNAALGVHPGAGHGACDRGAGVRTGPFAS